MPLELTLAPYWQSTGTRTVDIDIKFHGLICSVSGNTCPGGSNGGQSSGLVLNSGLTGFTRVDMLAPLRKEDLSISVSLEKLRKFIRPTEDIVSPLKSRDVLPNLKQVHSLHLSYDLKLTEASTVLLRFPRMEKAVYDSVWDHFAVYVFDSNSKKKLYYRDQVAKSLKLNPGSFVVKVQVASANLDMLDSIRGLICVCEIDLAKTIKLPLFSTMADVSTCSESSLHISNLNRGQQTTFWVGECKDYPKEAKFGDYLIGKIELSSLKLSSGNLYLVSYPIPPESIAKNSPSTIPSIFTPSIEIKKTEIELLGDAVRDLEISYISKLKDEKEQKDLVDRLEKSYPLHLPLFVKKLEVIVSTLEKSNNETNANTCLSIAEHLIQLIDKPSLAIYFGNMHETISDSDKLVKKDKDTEKSALISAYFAKAAALKALLKLESSNNSDSLQLIEKTLEDLAKWLSDPPTSNPKYLLYWSLIQRERGKFGCSLKVVVRFLSEPKNISDPMNSETVSKLTDVKMTLLEDLKWDSWVDYEARWKMVNLPVVGFQQHPF